LSSATFLLLESSKKSPDFDRSIFAEPLPHAKFGSVVNIDTSWRKSSLLSSLYGPSQAVVAVS